MIKQEENKTKRARRKPSKIDLLAIVMYLLIILLLFPFFLFLLAYNDSSSFSSYCVLHLDLPRICLPGSFIIVPLRVALRSCFLFLFLVWFGGCVFFVF